MTLGRVFTNHAEGKLAICYVSNEVKDLAIRFSRDGVNVTLACRPSDSVPSDVIVVPDWVCSVLNVSHGEACEYIPVDIVADLGDIQVELIFSAYQCRWQWSDMLPTTNSLCTPQTWRFDWPSGVDVQILRSMLPSLLQDTILSHDLCIAVPVFDMTMLFHVLVIDPELSSLSFEWNQSLSITLITNDSNAADVSVKSEDTSACVCYPTVMDRLVGTYQQLVCPLSACGSSFVNNSVLLCAPEGSGKSYLLSQYMNQLERSFAVVCCRSSSSTLTPSSTAPCLSSLDELLSSSGLGGLADEVSAHNQMLAYLKILMKALVVPETHSDAIVQMFNGSENERKSAVVWVIDDLDQIFLQYTSSLDSAADNEDGATATVQLGNHFQIAGYLLHQLLKLLSQHKSDFCRLKIVGACRLDVRNVPRSHTGAPEFEKVLSLPRLSAVSRQNILSSLLSDLLSDRGDTRACGLSLSELPSSLIPTAAGKVNSQTDETRVDAWAERLAGLTAGYCPGDLVEMIKHTALLHRGKAGLSRHDGQPLDVLQWDTAMQAMLSLPPKQLQSLGIESSGGSSSTSGRKIQRLSWNDFGGYVDTIALLKRLLTPRSTGITPTPQSVTLDPGETIIPGRDKNGVVMDFSSRLSEVPKGIVLYGPTGCGKSLLAKIIATEAKMNFVSIRSTEILSKYFGQTESAIRSLFQKARSAAPCVLFFDEFDAIAYKRGADDEGGNGLHGRVLSTFLNELDGVTSANDRGFESSVMVLAACSDVATLDEALVRPGRLQYHILLDKPTCEDVQSIIRNQISSMSVDESVNVLQTATLLMTMHPSCADAEALCQKALFGAIREEIQSHSVNQSGCTAVSKRVQQRHFNLALSELTGLSVQSIEGMKPREAVFQWSGSFNVAL